MNDTLERIYEEAHSAWRFRWIAMIIATVVALAGWAIVFTVPDRYEAGASVFVDTRTALRPVLQGLTVEQDVNVQLNYVRQSLLSGERLEKIARDSGVLPAAETDPRRIAGIMGSFAQRIVLDVRSAGSNDRDGGSVYSFRYQDGDRERGLKVVQTVVDTFVEETLGGKRAGSESAQKFLEVRIKEYEDRLSAAETRLADFKKENMGLMPTEQGGYFAQIQGEMDAATRVENALAVAVSRRAELSRQLRGEAVIGATGTTAASGNAAGGNDTVSRINETQARLDELLLRFTERHPEVIAARTTLAELRARREREIEQLRRGDAGAVAATGVSSNPVYQSIQLQLNQVDVEIASLRGQLTQHRAKAAELRKRLDSAPKVEAEFAQLNRDYDIIKAQYTALLANYEKSQLGERADDAGSVRFEIVRPPSSPYGPVSPARTRLLLLTLAGALALGGAVAYLLHLLNPVVGSLRGLTDTTGLSVIGVVSAAFPERRRAQARRELAYFLGAGAALAGACMVAVVLNWSGVRLPLLAAGAG